MSHRSNDIAFDDRRNSCSGTLLFNTEQATTTEMLCVGSRNADKLPLFPRLKVALPIALAQEAGPLPTICYDLYCNN